MIGVRFPPVLIALAEKAASDETRLRQQLTVDYQSFTHAVLLASLLLIMAALRSRCGHYIFAMWFLSIFFFFFLA